MPYAADRWRAEGKERAPIYAYDLSVKLFIRLITH